jgi:hypothetical protein
MVKIALWKCVLAHRIILYYVIDYNIVTLYTQHVDKKKDLLIFQ